VLGGADGVGTGFGSPHGWSVVCLREGPWVNGDSSGWAGGEQRRSVRDGEAAGGGIFTCPSFRRDKLGARGQWPTHQTVVAQRVEGPAGTVVAANVIGMSRLGAGARTRGWSIWPMVRAGLGDMWNCASGLGHTVSLGCALLACFLIPKRFSKFTQSSEFKNAKHDISSS
jgi:hypothetical protein